MATLTEKQRAGAHIVREVDIDLSRKKVVLVSGANYLAASVLGKVTASGKFTLYDPAASNGSEVVAGILFADVDAAATDKKGVIHKALTVIKPSLLVWKAGITTEQKAAALAVLEGKFVVGSAE